MEFIYSQYSGNSFVGRPKYEAYFPLKKLGTRGGKLLYWNCVDSAHQEWTNNIRNFFIMAKASNPQFSQIIYSRLPNFLVVWTASFLFNESTNRQANRQTSQQMWADCLYRYYDPDVLYKTFRKLHPRPPPPLLLPPLILLVTVSYLSHLSHFLLFFRFCLPSGRINTEDGF